MPRNKSITSIDNRIKKVQEDLFKTKARLDKLTAELRGLEREKKLRQADAILQALSKEALQKYPEQSFAQKFGLCNR